MCIRPVFSCVAVVCHQRPYDRSAGLQQYLQELIEVDGVWDSDKLLLFLDDDRRTLSLQVCLMGLLPGQINGRW